MEIIGNVLEFNQDNYLVFDREDIVENSGYLKLLDEIDYYEGIKEDFRKRYNQVIQVDGLYSRRIYESWVTPPSETGGCITMIHLLRRDTGNIMNVYMRSSDLRKFSSDLGFLSELAREYDVSTLSLMIGSSHINLLSQEIQ